MCIRDRALVEKARLLIKGEDLEPDPKLALDILTLSLIHILAHPECTEAVRLLADHICSTENMIPYCTETPAKSFIIVTESGILHRLRKLVPDVYKRQALPS